jgi:ElaB/YqjD/DUF883 family membrane-anchored ribosome-binding protein
MNTQPKPDVADATAPLSGTLGKVLDQVVDKAARGKLAVPDVGRKTSENLDSQNEAPASTLDQAISVLRQQAKGVTAVEAETAHAVNTTAQHGLRNMQATLNNLEDLVRRYPGAVIGVAAVVGFVIGRLGPKALSRTRPAVRKRLSEEMGWAHR